MKRASLLSMLVALTLLATATPVFFLSEDTAASFQADSQDMVLYLSGGATSGVFTLTGSNVGNASWSFEDAGNGLGVADYNSGSSTATGSSVTVNARQAGTIYAIATVGSEEQKLYVIVLAQPGDSDNGEFLFYLQIINTDHRSDFSESDDEWDMLQQGIWVRGYGATAFQALVRICELMQWDYTYGPGGWYYTFMGLNTYYENGGFTYWIQYHWEGGNDGAWYFNNTTLGYIEGTSSTQYIGMIFDLSLAPTNGVNYDESMPPVNVMGFSAP